MKFAGAYHGHVDGLLAEGGSGLATAGVPASPGVTEAQASDTVIVPWNDEEAVVEAISRGRPAAVIAEAIPANMGVVPADPGFLEAIRDTAAEVGSLLILDEVISGFRVARGGAQELLGIEADLTVMGKVIGGGLPAAAYGGRRELMERIAPAGDVYQAGTLSGNPLAVAAGLATLRKLDGAAYIGIESATTRLATGLRRAAGDLPGQVASVPGLVTVFFSADPVRTGMMRVVSVPRRRPRLISATVNSSPSRYLWVSSSSISATASIMPRRWVAASSASSAGMSRTSMLLPRSSR
jgi:glutamate-1-semialdehyde 2,1-aminomutase